MNGFLKVTQNEKKLVCHNNTVLAIAPLSKKKGKPQ